jgi:hypothetical protein
MIKFWHAWEVLQLEKDRRGGTAFLDEVRVKRGNRTLVQSFQNLVKADEKDALAYLNDERLCFPTFYVLAGEIDRFRLSHAIHPRSQQALGFFRNEQTEFEGDVQTVHPTLKWIVMTGGEDHIDGNYLNKMDKATSLLTMIYRDHAMLPTVANMIFSAAATGCPIIILCRRFWKRKIHTVLASLPTGSALRMLTKPIVRGACFVSSRGSKGRKPMKENGSSKGSFSGWRKTGSFCITRARLLTQYPTRPPMSRS